MADGYIEVVVMMRSKTTFGTDTQNIRVWEGRSVKDEAARVASGYGAVVVEIKNPDGSIFSGVDLVTA